ncbi:MAG: hypothetical protein EOQ81_28465 [Mesorhizobium sp.]|nr:MAG: hypothetical protein EOQ81_28465 [Mesorhizobium sp.]
MIVGGCACLCPDFSGIAATFSSVTAGTGSPSATTDGVALPGSIAASLTMDGVEVAAPSTTMDEACAKPLVVRRPITTAPRAIPGKGRNSFPFAIASKQDIRITTTLRPPTGNPHPSVGELMPTCAET